MSEKFEPLSLGVRETDAGWVGFLEFRVNGVPKYEETEPAAAKVTANQRLIELLRRVCPPVDGREESAK